MSLSLPNPYVGPRPIHRGEAFYGRDPELRRLTNLLAAERIVLLHAPSGAGKSSLLNAGLLPKLEQEKKLQLLPVVRVNRLPEDASALPEGANRYLLSVLLSMEEAFGEAAIPEAELAVTSLAEYLAQRWPADPEKRGLLLLLDQFEEVFSLDPYDRDAKLEFFTQLGVTLQNRELKTLFLMRDDYIGALEPYAVYLPTQLQATFRLDFLDHSAALEAILKPAQQGNILFEEQAARNLVHDLSLVQFQRLDGTLEQQEGPYVEPVQLQVVCKRMWERLDTAGRLLDGIDEADVEQLGDVSDALAGYYRDTVSAVARQQKVSENRIRNWIGKELISEQGVRGQIMQAARQTKGLPNEIITALEGAHLLRREERRRVIWYELAHDRLVPPIQRDNLRFHEAQRARRLKQVFAGLGILVLIILLISGFSTWRANSQTSAAQGIAQQATQGAAQAQANAQQATQDAAQAQANAQLATLDVATAQVNATQAALALLPIQELQALSRSTDPEVRSNAARALGNAGAANPKLAVDTAITLTSLVQASNENSVGVRLAAAQGLVQIAESNPSALVQSVKGILNAADDTEPELRRLVAQLLGRVGPYVRQADLDQVLQTLEKLSVDPIEQVRLTARESLDDLSTLGMENYLDNWVNTDAQTRSWTRIEIQRREDELGYHIFGSCVPTDCDAGEVWEPYEPGPQVFTLDKSFATYIFTVTLDLEAQVLNVESFTQFLDDSGRSDFYSTNRFVREDLAQPTLTPTLLPTLPPTGPRLFAALFWESPGLAMIDVGTLRVLNTTKFPSINARFLSLNPQRGEVYVSFSNGDTLYIVDALSGEIKGTITEEVGWNSSASAVSPDGKRLYLATSGGPEKDRRHKILVIDPAAQQLLKVIDLGSAPFPAGLNGLAISPDGRWLYTIESESFQLLTIELETSDWVALDIKGNQLAGISKDGRYLYLVGYGTLLKMEAATTEIVWDAPGVREYIDRVAIGGGLVYVPGEKEGVLVLDDESGKVIAEIAGPSGGSLVLAPDGERLYATPADENAIIVYDARRFALVDVISITAGSGPTDLIYWVGR